MPTFESIIINDIQWKALQKAPKVWRPWSVHGATIVALRDRGLVQTKSFNSRYVSSQWRISARGLRLLQGADVEGPW